MSTEQTFFEKLGRVHAIVRSGPTYRAVNELGEILQDHDVRRAFFLRLDDPAWLLPLHENGYFESPPEVREPCGGGVQHPQWPESVFLAHMASRVPNVVARIFGRMDTQNASVIGDMLDASLAMTPADAVVLVPSVCRASEQGWLWIHFKDASDLCMKLIHGGEHDAALQLAQALFAPKTETNAEHGHRRDAHWYKEGLGRVAPELARLNAPVFLPVLCSWLDDAVRAKTYVNPETGDDGSCSWRPAIEDHEQNHDFVLAGAIVGIAKAAFEEAIREDAISLDDALAVIEKQHFLVFKRMRVHLVGEFADRRPDLARAVMLNRELFDDYRYKHEYAVLVSRRWGLLSKEQRNEWFGWVNGGPKMSDFDEKFRRYKDREATEDDRQSRMRWWKYEKLHWIRDHLAGEGQHFYEQMRREYGEPELADLNVRMSSGRAGGISPISAQDLETKTFEDAVEMVTSWRPTSTALMAPNIEDLATSFREYLKKDRKGFSSQATLLRQKPAIFVREFISEMTVAVNAGDLVDVQAVLELCQWVVDRPVSDRTVPAQGDEVLVDKDWQWTRNEISRFTEAVCRAQTDSHPTYSLADVRDPIWKLIDALSRDPAQSNVVDEVEKSDPRTRDYFHLGINSSRGKSVEAAFEYARWVGSHSKVVEGDQAIVPSGFDAMPEFREMLEWQMAPENRTCEVLSIIGAKVGIIYWIDKNWLGERAGDLFYLNGIERTPSAPEGWAAWNAFLVWVQPHFEFYRRFRPQFAYAVQQSANVTLSDGTYGQPLHRLGEHLMILYGWYDLNLDDDGQLIRHFIQNTEPEIRRHAISFVGTSLERDGNVPYDVLQRFMALWELYWAGPGRHDAEQKKDVYLFGPWFACGKFPAKWSIHQLREFVEVAPVVEPDFTVVEQLAEIAAVDVRTSTQILDRMVRGDKEGWRVSGWAGAAEKILSLAMKEGGDVRREAEDLINHLGRRGNVEFGKLLERSP